MDDYGKAFQRDPQYDKAIELWCFYEVECETFDRAVCTGGIGRDGGAMPRGGRELGAVNRNADKVRRKISDMSIEEGIDRETMDKARKHFASGRFTYRYCREIVECAERRHPDRFRRKVPQRSKRETIHD